MPSGYEIHIHTGAGGSGPPPGGVDHFAPKYLVGNVPAGDSPIPYATAGFIYIPDIGDGAGIASALASAAITPGDVWLRPGLYDLGAGAVVAPLVVPGGTRVMGAGQTTNIRSRPSGDQGVFVLASTALGVTCELRDVLITSVAATDGTGISTALVRCTDPSVIEDVDVRLVTTGIGVLREAIRFETSTGSPLPLNRLVNVRIGVSTDGTEATPVSGFHAVGGCTVAGQQVEVYDFAGPGGSGFAHALLSSTGASFIINVLTVFGYNVAAVKALAGGSIRIDEAILIAGSTAGAATNGIDLTGGGHVLRSITILGGIGGVTGGTAVALTASPGNIQIDDVQAENFAIGVDAGDAGSAAFDVSVVNSTFNIRALGIRLRGPGTSACHLRGNAIFLNTDGVTPFIAGIHLVGGVHQNVDGNQIVISGDPQSLAPTVHGIWIDECQLSTFNGNMLTVNYCGYAIEIAGERNTVVSNVTEVAEGPGCIHIAPPAQGPRVRNVVNSNSCTMNLSVQPAPLPAAIVHEGSSCTISNNAIFMGTPVPPADGIVLTATSQTSPVLGNVTDGSSGSGVLDLGTGNEIAHNIGV